MTTRLALVLLLAATLVAPISAPARAIPGTTELEVSYVPLDSRPFPGRTPVFLGQLALAEVDTPPREWLGQFMEPGRVEAVADWWKTSAAETDVSVLNVAMLTVGGLVPSRECDTVTTDTALARLAVLDEVRRDNPGHRIVATHSIQRLASNLYGRYPGTYAGEVRDWGVLRDRVLNLGHEHLRDEYETLTAEIPAEIRDDHLCARARNQAINKALVDLVADDVVDRLVIGVDDAEEYGLHRAERARLREHIDGRGVGEAVDIYVGTDVNGSLLMVGEAMRHSGLTPRVAVDYSGMPGQDWVAPYQDQPYSDVIETYVAELGGELTDDPSAADVHLMANTPGPGDRGAFHDRVAALAARGEVVVVSDDVNPGVTDPNLYERLSQRMQLAHLGGYSGWNVGAALAQGLARWSTLERADAGGLAPGGSELGDGQPAHEVHTRLQEAARTHLAVLVEAFTHEHHYRNFVRSQVRDLAVAAGDDPQWFQFVHDEAQALAIRDTRPRAESMFATEFRGEPIAIGALDDTMEFSAATSIQSWDWGLPWPRYQELIATPSLTMSDRPADFASFVRAAVTPAGIHVRPGTTTLPPFTATVGRATSQPVTVTISADSELVATVEPLRIDLRQDTTITVPLELEAASGLPEGIHTIDIVIEQRRPNGDARRTTVPVQLDVSVPNLALATRGVTAEADSVFSSYLPELAIDGDRTSIRSRWVSGTTEPHHLTLTFPEATAFDEVSLFHYGGYELRDYTLEARTDGQWATLVEVTDNDQATTTHTFPVATAKALRLTVTDSRDTRARLYEIEVRCRSDSCP